jgi:hypothetical protein
MDDQQFDRLVEALGRGLNRRGVLGVLAGAAGLGVGEVAAKRRKRGKSRVQAQAANKVAVCHYDAGANTYVLINVSRSGWDHGHSKHENDFLRGGDDDGAVGCCTDGECGELTNACGAGVCDPETGTCAGPCAVGEQCVGGACVAVCDEPWLGSGGCSCRSRVGASGGTCVARGVGCASRTCSSDAQCSDGEVCAFALCCPNPTGLCFPRCEVPDECTCTSGPETCDLSAFIKCGANAV